MAYLGTADLRGGALYPHIAVPTTVTDARLSAMIGAAGRAVDTYCKDHFAPTEGGTITLVPWESSYVLPVPRRVRGVASVTVVAPDDTTTVIPAASYRVHSSFDVAPYVDVAADADRLVVVERLDAGNAVGAWPVDPWTVRVVGNFDWADTPEEVKYATALIVKAWTSDDLPPNVESADSATLRFVRPRGDDTTGVIEADRVLTSAGLRRTQYAGIARTV